MTNSDPESSSPRALFAQRFAELYAAAGNPTLRRVASATERRMRNTQAGTPSAQRISDWKAGRNVPARFESLLPVILTLVDLARKAQRELPRALADPHEWRRLWQESVTWTATAGEGDTCPFPGLRAFRADERALFFGRERATADFVDLVRGSTGIVVLIGASGAGKSSLLAAGLRPALDLPSATMTPGATPTAALAAADTADLRVLVVDQFEELFTLCRDETERADFLTALAALTTRPADPITVVLALRADFYEPCLHHPVLRESLQHNSYLLGPMTMDEVSRAVTGPAAAAGLTLEQGLEELVRTELHGLGGHTGADGYDPGALPLLSHVMAATWQQREGRKLTVAGYRKAGGVAGSVAETAELAWTELTPAQQHAAQEMLGALVTVGEDARDTRRTVPRADLLTRGGDPDAAAEALEVLAAARLIALDADSVQFSHEIVLTAWPRLRGWIDTDRVGHLVRQRLESDAAEWETTARDSALLYRGTRLDSATAHTRDTASPRARAFLAASGRSARRGRRWRIGAAAIVLALLATGVVAFDRGRLADQRTADRDYTELVAAAQRTQVSDPSLSAQLMLAAYRMRPDEATRTQLLNTQERPLAITTPSGKHQVSELAARPTDDLLVSVSAEGNPIFWNIGDPVRPRRLTGGLGVRVNRLIFLPGSTDAVTDGPAGIQLWDVARPESVRLIQRLGTLERRTIAVDATGTRLAETDSSTLVLWDIRDRARPTITTTLPLTGDDHSVGFSPDGTLLSVGTVTYDTSAPDTVQLWDIRTPAALPVGPPLVTTAAGEYLLCFAFSPDGAHLAVGTYGTRGAVGATASRVELWQIADPRRPHLAGAPIHVDGRMLSSILFHPDGQLLATASDDGARLWNITDPSQPVIATPTLSVTPTPCPSNRSARCDGGPLSMLFAPGTSTLLGAGSDGNLRSWSLPRSTVGMVPGSPDRPVFDRAGDRMAILSGTGEVTVWDTTDPGRPARLSTIPGAPGLSEAGLSADGRTLSIHDKPGARRLVYDLDDPRRPRPLPSWPIDGAERSTVDGDRMLLTYPNSVQMWDVSDRTAPARLGAPIKARVGTVHASGLSPDGSRVELVLFDDRGDWLHNYYGQVWNLDDPQHPWLAAETDVEMTTVFQPSLLLPDNRTVAITQFDRFGLWEFGSPGKVTPLADTQSEIYPLESVSAATDGSALALTSSDGTTSVWDLGDPRAPRRSSGPLGPSDGRHRRAVLHPRGEHLMILTDNGQLGVWDLDPQRVAERICRSTGDLLTEDVWRRQLPHVPYRPPCA
ncbi:nSTAND1 domain-containing NTPase [Nocardia asteroides]|uniref:nSTAND1 domain-containing NTPase n=1 Tax=Nocardia asteroides TaxID=1824 RepID=UPI00364C8D72